MFFIPVAKNRLIREFREILENIHITGGTRTFCRSSKEHSAITAGSLATKLAGCEDAKLISLIGYRLRRIERDRRVEPCYIFMDGKGGRTHTGNHGLKLF